MNMKREIMLTKRYEEVLDMLEKMACQSQN